MKKANGYTLIELLVVSGILVAVSGIVGGILVSTMRSSEVTRSTTQIAQNGNYALSSISELIKHSQDVSAVWNSNNSYPTNFAGCAGESSPEGDSLALMMPEGQEVQLTCSHSSGRVASTSGSMTYYLTNRELAVVQGSCKFVCNQNSAFSPPRIEVKFELGIRDGTTNNVLDGSSKVFQTQISSRNYINK